MNNTFFQKNKRVIGIVAAIIAFAAITLAYFNPILEGKRIKQHDIEAFIGMSKEYFDYLDQTGEVTLWTNSLFGGMPTWNISAPQRTNLFWRVNKLLNIGFPEALGAVFVSMLGFLILLLILDCNLLIAFIGAIAYGLASYMFIILGAGHNSKAMAMAYMAPVIAGIILAYKGKHLWGGVLTAFALALEIRSNHLQITYYLLLTIIPIVIAEFISDIKEKRLPQFFKASAVLLIAALFAIPTSSLIIYSNYVYGNETIRGKSILTQGDNTTQTNGLDRDYITQWSYGKGETWSLLIPNIKGGASAYIGKQNPALDKADRQFRDNIAQSNAYWGDQPGTSGPVYVGAIIVFLFLLGALTVKGKLKWALVAATILSILLSWGKNFMWFTNIFIDHVPGYSKFRAVSMTLVIAEVCIPILAALGLAEITKTPESFKQNHKKFYIALGISAGFCLLFYITPKMFFSFLSQGEAQQFAKLSVGADGALYQQFSDQLQNVRVAIFRKDAIRSFLFIILSAIPLWLFGKGKLKATPAFLILAALLIVDMVPIDKRYLNNDNFISKQKHNKPFTPTIADQFILDDKSLDFRVLNLTKDIFNDASTSYFHKSVGGYHGAKLRRYQDLINGYLNPEVKRFSEIFKADSDESLLLGLRQQKILNMLNTKYIIYNPEARPLINPEVYGNAWFVNDCNWVDDADAEFAALRETDLRHTAVVHKEFKPLLAGFVPGNGTEGSIEMTDYRPNRLTYSYDSPHEQLVVFSEIWTQSGWLMKVDGKEEPIIRVNYLLRAARIPSGHHEIVLNYAPKSWPVLNIIMLISSSIIILAMMALIIYTLWKRKA